MSTIVASVVTLDSHATCREGIPARTDCRKCRVMSGELVHIPKITI